MKIAVLHGDCFTGKWEAHEYISHVLGFPAYYGKNLDALADCLSELPDDVGVIITNMGRTRHALGGYADGITDTFADILGTRFRVCIFE